MATKKGTQRTPTPRGGGAKKAAAKKAAAKTRGPTTKPAAKKRATRIQGAASKRRERELYKVSPLRGMPVEEWIDKKTAGWQREVIHRIVAIVRRAAPRATCSIKWAQPVFEQNGPFAFVKPAKAHVSVGFWRGSEVVDPNGILERGDRMGHFKLFAADDLDERALAVMVTDAVRLNEKKGNPTVRTS